MASNPETKGTRELRVEHVHAALNQITELISQVRGALEGLDPKLVLRAENGDADGGPPLLYTVGVCAQAPHDPPPVPQGPKPPGNDPDPTP